jgi:hypothetical protein
LDTPASGQTAKDADFRAFINRATSQQLQRVLVPFPAA